MSDDRREILRTQEQKRYGVEFVTVDRYRGRRSDFRVLNEPANGELAGSIGFSHLENVGRNAKFPHKRAFVDLHTASLLTLEVNRWIRREITKLEGAAGEEAEVHRGRQNYAVAKARLEEDARVLRQVAERLMLAYDPSIVYFTAQSLMAASGHDRLGRLNIPAAQARLLAGMRKLVNARIKTLQGKISHDNLTRLIRVSAELVEYSRRARSVAECLAQPSLDEDNPSNRQQFRFHLRNLDLQPFSFAANSALYVMANGWPGMDYTKLRVATITALSFEAQSGATRPLYVLSSSDPERLAKRAPGYRWHLRRELRDLAAILRNPAFGGLYQEFCELMLDQIDAMLLALGPDGGEADWPAVVTAAGRAETILRQRDPRWYRCTYSQPGF